MATTTTQQGLDRQGRDSRMELSKRAAELRANAVEHIGNAAFDVDSVEDCADLLDVQARRTSVPPKDLPAHLARLCDSELLTADEERAMFRRMNFARFRADSLRLRLDPVTPDAATIAEVERMLKIAQQLRDQLIQANMRLAISVIKKFVSPQRSFDDMLSDGIFSLMQAVDKFDFDRGFRFSTYAYRAIARNAYRKMQVGQKEAMRLVHGDDEIYDVEELGSTSSLDDRTWELLRGALTGLMDRLERREQFIIRGRYALGRHRKVKTFQSLADKLGLSKERVRQLEQRAVAKLRRWSTELQVLG